MSEQGSPQITFNKLMKNRLVSPRHVFPFGLLVVLAIFLAVQWRTLSQLRAEKQRGLNDKHEQPGLVQRGGLFEKRPADDAEIERLRTENKDLHKLRNEVAQLRKRKPDWERANSENQRLQGMKREREEVAHLPDQPGFVPKESWADAGFGSPDSTTRTYFWALREGKFERLLECMTPDVRQELGREFQNPTDKERRNASRIFGQANGFRIAGKTVINDDEAVLRVQAPIFGGKPWKIPMKRFGNEWKISGEPGP